MQKFEYQCVTCGEIYEGDKIRYVCPKCYDKEEKKTPPKGLLTIQYDYENIKKSNLSWQKLVPYNKESSLPSLKVGDTPLYNWSAKTIQEKLELSHFPKIPFEILLKDDTVNPTSSFKDRASACVSAIAKEYDIETIITASTGNAASSLSGICAANNQNAIVLVPETAPKAKLIQSLQYGATVLPIKGSYDDCFDLCLELEEKIIAMNRNTAYNPFTIEGKKSVLFELFEQLSHTLPDKIYVPVGDGAIVSSIFKGIYDLVQLGVLDKIPEVVIVQADGSDNIVRNIHSDEFTSEKCKTIADSISVDIPRAYYMVQAYAEHYSSACVLVSDEQILSAQHFLASATGVFVEPSSAAAFAGMLSDWFTNRISEDEKVCVLCTGSGLKDTENACKKVTLIDPVNADILAVLDSISNHKK